MSPERTAEEYADTLERVAEEALRAAPIAAPPVDALMLARRLGMIVARDGAAAGRARRLRLGSRAGGAEQSLILLRDDPRPERRHWSVAHEIGEHLAHQVFQRLNVDPAEA